MVIDSFEVLQNVLDIDKYLLLFIIIHLWQNFNAF